jgi:UDP-2,3-diacylglucosamine pyrophosphatase LpxH
MFLQEANRQGGGATDLILNGDTFELWQSLEQDCIYSDKDLGCTEVDALHRLRRVLGAHTAELKALRAFATSGNNRVVIVPGNHDVALLFGRVAAEVLEAISAPADRVRVASEGFWLSADKLVYAEHGHQIGRDVNRFDNWPSPFLERNGQKHLQRPWGEQFVQQYYNDYEEKYPIIDNISEESLGVRYGLAAEGVSSGVRGFGRFLRFFFLEVSPEQFARALGPERAAGNWDVQAIRTGGERFFVESIPADNPFRIATQKALADGTLGLSLNDLSDDEIRAICDYRAVAFQAQRKSTTSPTVTVMPCPKARLGGTGEGVASNIERVRLSIFEEHLDRTLQALQHAGKTKTDRVFQLFVFSHTHRADAGFSPMKYSKRQWRPRVVNTGAWQRTISARQLDTIIQDRELTPRQILQTFEPEDLPPCYPAIFVRPYKENPESILYYWGKRGGEPWKLAQSCD